MVFSDMLMIQTTVSKADTIRFMNFHHRPIKRFSIEGTIYDEADVQRLRREYLALLILQMKSEGFSVRADIDEDFTMDFLGPRAGYKFKLSVYGTFIGKKKAQEVDRLYGYRALYAKDRTPKTEQKRADTKGE